MLREKLEVLGEDLVDAVTVTEETDDGISVRLDSDNLDTLNKFLQSYSKYLEADSKIVVAEIDAKAKVEAAHDEQAARALDSVTGFVSEVIRGLLRHVDLKNIIYTEEGRHTILPPKYLNFWDKK